MRGSRPSGPDYLRDPVEIYRRSFAAIRAEADLAQLPTDLEVVAVRLIHACGMPDIADDLVASDGAVAAGKAALTAGASVLVDSNMVAAGIIRARLPAENAVICALDDPTVADRARAAGTTRSAAAVELWQDHLEGAVVAIGNAPTALFRLLELIADGAPRPALVLGFAVGFVGAAESKDALIGFGDGLDYIAVRGRRGGSAMAAAAVNALAGEMGWTPPGTGSWRRRVEVDPHGPTASECPGGRVDSSQANRRARDGD